MVATAGSDWTLAPSLVAFFRQADAGWPDRLRASDGSIGDAAHSARMSDHNPALPRPPGWVDAGDLTRDEINGPGIDALWDHLIATRDHRVKYLIHRGRIVKSYVDSAGRPAWEPQPYTGTSPHDHHIHVSVTPAGRFDTGPWFPTDNPAPTAPESLMEDDVKDLIVYQDDSDRWWVMSGPAGVAWPCSAATAANFEKAGATRVLKVDSAFANAVAS